MKDGVAERSSGWEVILEHTQSVSQITDTAHTFALSRSPITPRPCPRTWSLGSRTPPSGREGHRAAVDAQMLRVLARGCGFAGGCAKRGGALSRAAQLVLPDWRHK